MDGDLVEPFELQFSDLLLLSSTTLAKDATQLSRLESVAASVIESLGPSGPGLLAVTGVPRAPALRSALLPLARKLALLGHKDRARVLKKHGLGSDVPLKNLDRTVTSFALQLKYGEYIVLASPCSGLDVHEGNKYNSVKNCVTENDVSDDGDFEKLGAMFKELGFCMIELGIRLAQVCGKVTGCVELESSVLESGSAKGRLIHYHSKLDNYVIKEMNKRLNRTKNKTEHHEQISIHQQCPEKSSIEERIKMTTFSSLWQQWHYDYGLFTVLTSPLFMLSCQSEGCSHVSCSRECYSPDGHTYLQIYDVKKNKVFSVRSRLDSFIIQVGEAADILSGGQLRSTLHSVGRPEDIENLSRENFVVFLQPSWTRTLTYSGHSSRGETEMQQKLLNGETECSSEEKSALDPAMSGSLGSDELLQEILRVPPLANRFRNGMTFAEFSSETTKQYYSGNGTQSLR